MKLFERVKIGNLELKNRLGMAPMGTKFGADHIQDDRCIPYYEERAKGGFGLIITGGYSVIDRFEPQECPKFMTPHDTPAISVMIDRVHNAGGKICIMLNQGVGRNCWFIDGKPPKSASACDWFWNPGVKCIPFEKEEIHEMVAAMGKSAGLAKACGADMILIGAYGGYLMDQFLTELWNTRTDEYGGSFENRMRFLKETYEAARAAVGPDFPIAIKYTPEHKLPGGRTLEEGVRMGLEMEKWGVNALHVDLGSYDRWYLPISTTYSPEGYHTYMAAALKEAGVKIPIFASGNMKNPEVAEAAVASGAVDVVLLGHQSKADAYYPKKLKNNRAEDIRPCIGCNECLNGGQKGGRITGCGINPRCYYEEDYPVTPVSGKRKVLIIGAGPGGCEAALMAKSRGCDVEIWEKTDAIGGNLKAAGAPKFKKPIRDYVKYHETQLRKSEIPVYFNKEATVENIKEGNFDHIICASGSSPIIPNIPGVDGANVLDSEKAMCGEALTGNIVVIGGGLVGCEAAVQFAETADNVTILELQDDILKGAMHSKNMDLHLRYLVEEAKVDVKCSAKVTKIEDTKVVYEMNGETCEVSCDKVVLAVGYKPNTTFVESLKDNFDYEMLDVIGDANKADKVLTAVHQGYHAARNIE